MANSTLTPDNKEDAGERYSSEHIRNMEQNGTWTTADQDQYDATVRDAAKDGDAGDAIREAEENPMGYEAVGAARSANRSSKGGLAGKILNYKKGGPLGVVIALIFGGGIGIGSLFSPALLTIHFKEMLGRFNTQLTSMDKRFGKVLGGKINDTTKGGCGKISVIKCKYASMSDRQVKKFKAAGIEVVGEDTTVTGRTKPTSFKFDGREISPKDFVKTLNNDAGFRAAVKTAYNPKLAGFSDQIFKKLSARYKLSKASSGLEDKQDDKERAKALQEATKEGSADVDKAPAVDCEEGRECKRNGSSGDVDQEEAGKANTIADAIGDAAKESGDETVASDVLSKAAAGTATEAFTSIFKITGVLDNACTVYGTIRAVGFAAKTVRYAQLIRFAMVLSTVADKEKAGTAQPEEASYVGNMLTNTVLKSDGSHSPSATDSSGFKLAAYGDYKMSDNANKFLVGGGLAGTLTGVTSIINSTLGGTPKQTCGFLANPFVQVGSAVIGIAFMFVPFAGQAGTASRLAIQAGLGIAFSIAMALLPAILADTIAGNIIDLNPTPEDVGDAWASGSGALSASLSNAGGGAPLTVDQAVAYNQDTKSVNAQYAAEDRATLSPLDPTSSNTFMGSIVTTMLPVMANTASLTNLAGSTISLAGRSLGNIVTPASNAAEEAEYYKQCDDEDYNDIYGDGSGVKVATDPNCNIIFGLPDQYLDLDPQDVIDKISDDIDPDTGAPSSQEYKDFVDHCVDRENGGEPMPFGYAGDDQTFSTGGECLLNEKNLAEHPKYPYFYVHLVDQRIRGAMDEEDQETDDIQDGQAGDAGGTDIGGTKQELAKAIVASNKVTYLAGVGSSSEARKKIITDIADGKTNGDSAPCGMNIKSLQLIKFLADHHASVQIGDTNSLCTGATQGRRAASRHIGGNGSAVDIVAVDGTPVNGANAKSLAVLQEIKPLLSTGSGYSSQSQVGQVQCRGRIDLGKVIQFVDACSHIHVDFPTSADPDLVTRNGAS